MWGVGVAACSGLMSGLALPSGQDQAWWTGIVGSGRAAGWMGVTATGTPGPDPSNPLPVPSCFLTYSCPWPGKGTRPGVPRRWSPCLVLEKGIQALMRTNGSLENSFVAPR